MIYRVRRPSRYVNGEWGAVRKDAADVRIALAFPDAYEIGMSHLGLKILYGLVNDIPWAAAERVFAPWPDCEAELRRCGHSLSTLETGRPLGTLDAVGFSLQYELSYTNVLAMLDLGGIPLRSRDRGREHPIVLAGGPSTMNPAPLSSFVDAFVLGDGEDIVPEILALFRDLRARGDRIDALARMPGLFVPMIHGTGGRVRRLVVEDLETAYYPTRPVVAHQAVHDRVAVEIGRGCPRGCRFCQAGMIYRPLRERSVETVLRLADEAVRSTGYRELAFTSLSAGDYCGMEMLLREANRLFSGRHVSLSLPSLRVGSLNRAIVREMKSERKSGFTIAPEAGTARLRAVINKDIDDEGFYDTLRLLFEEGWEQIKLYFMIGLPTETQEDVEGIVRMVREGLRVGRAARKKSVEFNVGVSSFVPKPHTPFQWEGQMPLRDLRERQDWLRNALPRRQARFKGQKVELSALEAILCRGGAEAGELVEQAFREGCRFDAWTEGFDFSAWTRAMDRAGLGWEAAERRTIPGAALPWSMVDTGLSEEFLVRERNRSLEGSMTEECRRRCSACGLECGDTRVKVPAEEPSGKPEGESRFRWAETNPVPLPVTATFRIRYGRSGDARFLSHRETMNVITRSLNRADIPLEYSRGFHPHPKLSFGPPLPVGVESDDEYVDVKAAGALTAEGLLARLRAFLPRGFSAHGCRGIGTGVPSLGKFIVRYDYVVGAPKPPYSGGPLPVMRDGGETIDIAGAILRLEQQGDETLICLTDTGDLMVRFAEVMGALGFGSLGGADREVRVRRVGLWGRSGGGWATPMEV